MTVIYSSCDAHCYMIDKGGHFSNNGARKMKMIAERGGTYNGGDFVEDI